MTKHYHSSAKNKKNKNNSQQSNALNQNQNQSYNNNSNKSSSNSCKKHFLVRSKPTNGIFSSGATLVEEEDFNELTAVPTTTIVVATNAKYSTKRPLLTPLKLTPTTTTRTAKTIAIAASGRNVLHRQYATQQAIATPNLIAQASEESQATESTPLVGEAVTGITAISAANKTTHRKSSATRAAAASAAAAASLTTPSTSFEATQDDTINPTPSTTTTAAVAATSPNVSTTYSHNSKTTRSWPVIYRNPHHYDYEALYARQASAKVIKPAPAPASSATFRQNCYSNQFAQSIVYTSSNEDLTTAINECGSSGGGGSGIGINIGAGGYERGSASGSIGIGGGTNHSQATCYYFAPSRHNSIYEHPSAVVHSSLQFDPAAATTAAAAAAVESLRRSNSLLLRNSSCSKIMQAGVGGAIDSPTSLNSAMDGTSGTGAACCTSCCMGPPPVLFLFVTLLMTTSATAMLCAAIMTDHWEHVTWDRASLDRYTNRTNLRLEWMMDDKVAMLKPDKKSDHRFRRDTVFLVPMHGGIWTLCIDLPLPELQELRRNPKFPRGAPPCVNYLAGSMENARGEEQRNDWQHSESQTSLQPHLRMQNLSISCSLVCLIILGSAALVGAFGVCQRQISAILITGVMYLLAALFALFTLMIIHFKRQQGRPMLDSDYDGTVDGIVARPGGVAILAKPLLGARIFLTSWSLDLGWGGVVLCAITSVLWILLSKIMRYNPFSALMI